MRRLPRNLREMSTEIFAELFAEVLAEVFAEMRPEMSTEIFAEIVATVAAHLLESRPERRRHVANHTNARVKQSLAGRAHLPRMNSPRYSPRYSPGEPICPPRHRSLAIDKAGCVSVHYVTLSRAHQFIM